MAFEINPRWKELLKRIVIRKPFPEKPKPGNPVPVPKPVKPIREDK